MTVGAEDRCQVAGRTIGVRPPTRGPCGSTRSCARCWPRSSSGWPTPTSGCGWSRSPSVDTAPDLRHATVYLSSLSEDAADALAERRAQLQRALGRQMRMKRTPLLEFAVDPAVVAGSRVDEVLRRIRSDEVDEPDGPDDPAAGPDR